MDWTRSETLGLAFEKCSYCHGAGLRLGRKNLEPCNCVLRRIFRICYDKFIRLATQERYLSRVSLAPSRGRQRPSTWGRKDEEYLADFCLVAHRALDEVHGKVFRYHMLLGADWKLCCRQLKMDRGNFFHAVYRIEQRLGRVFRELEPYALFPLDEYFSGVSKLQGPGVARPEFAPRAPLVPPMAEPGFAEPLEDQPAARPGTSSVMKAGAF